MPGYQNIEDLFTKIKNCDAADIAGYFSEAINIFPTLTKAERQECTHSFYSWAEENKNPQKQKFYYAKFLVSLNYFLAEQHEQALHLVVETKNLFDEISDCCGTGCCLGVMGGIYRTLGNYDLALKTLWEAYRMLGPLKLFSHIRSACSFNIGSIYFEMHNADEAIHLFNNTLRQSEEAGDYFWMNYAFHGLGKVYLSQDKFEEAKIVLENAVAHAEENKNPLAISNSLTELANYHFHVGDYTEAEELHRRALIIREDHNFIGGAVTNYIRLAEVLIKHSKLNEATDVLQKGLQLAKQIKVNPKIYRVHFLLSEIYQEENELEKSLFHYKKFHEVREQVEIEDSAKKIKNVQLVFEAEQTMKENIIIKKQKAEIEKKNTELQETIDELTRAKISKKAKAFTLVIAIVFFIFEDAILHFALNMISTDNYYFSLVVKMVIIFSLSPINKAIEKYLLKRVIKNKSQRSKIDFIKSNFETVDSSPVLMKEYRF